MTVDRELIVRRLHQRRSRSRFVRISLALLAIVALHEWVTGELRFDDFLSARRLGNLERFVDELRPFPLQSQPWDWNIAAGWFHDVMVSKGWDAAVVTLAMSIAAICLAGAAALVISVGAARSLAAAEPYLPRPTVPSAARRLAWTIAVAAVRALLIFLRAIPEYVWAFLLVAIVGPTLWTAVFALAIHNTGILGKLNAEAIENLESETFVALRGLGAARRQIALIGVLPTVVPRFLLFFFYRWETCLREATVLGMLGIASLGFFIQDARARQHYDVMLALILVGSAIVLIGDLLSAAAREAVRRSS